MILTKLKNDAEARLGEKITEAVITVPAYFNPHSLSGGGTSKLWPTTCLSSTWTSCATWPWIRNMPGIARDLQIERILAHVRVIDDRICFHQKTAELVADVFRFRAKMHCEVYQHHATLAIEAMVCDILKILARCKTGKSSSTASSTNGAV